jgi:hypothetical protein
MTATERLNNAIDRAERYIARRRPSVTNPIAAKHRIGYTRPYSRRTVERN